MTEPSRDGAPSIFARIHANLEKVIRGKSEALHGILVAYFAGGHILFEDIPGVGKTTAAKALARSVGARFRRVQFTPDLMPGDITGVTIYNPQTGEFVFRPGPVFCEVLLADEFNRGSPRTQSALLEAMSEWQVTVEGEPRHLASTFSVLATQNPIEFHGTYPLPEAQLDRFFFKVLVPRPGFADMVDICDRTTGVQTPRAGKVIDGPRILAMRELSRRIPVPGPVKSYAVRVVMATQPSEQAATPTVKQYVRYGASPRGAQALLLAAKVRALVSGRVNVAFEDIKALAKPVLRHRVLVNFEAEADGRTSDQIVDEIVGSVREVGDEVAKIAAEGVRRL